ncbi:hypothetical protein BZG36_03670 [Bifiguratus adelaidae]|uniref:MSP domain-containing protein n=1 Tax=Bifiguratus adelaidae TaxID=1938954 RepID=A0A261XZS9_9FUNG|nr:hypothetical protein BZG36_03670 [Bifiguratus adelaidae]
MAVTLEPDALLSFRRPFQRLVKENLVITNTNAFPVAFKVKTTAPKQYCVRPNSGRIEPHASSEVQVILQPMTQDPPEDFKSKDKFLVQSVRITDNVSTLSIQDLWARVEKESKDQISEHKLRCLFLPAEEAVNGPVEEEEDTQEIRDKLKVANEKIAQLQSSIDDYKRQLAQQEGLRSRNAEPVNKALKYVKPQDAVHQVMEKMKQPKVQEGYPAQVLVIVAIVVFLIAYLFF